MLIKRMKPLGFKVESDARVALGIRQLSDPNSTKTEREAARRTIREYAVLAAESCEELRKRLSHADEFAKLLGEETLVRRTSAAGS